jgi:hypothetical protein
LEKTMPRLLLVNGVILGAVALLQFNLDIVGYAFGFGPTGIALHANLDAIGYTEAHGLAAIAAFVLIIRRKDGRASWHGIAATIHLLLGACNLAFWPVFTRWGLEPMGVLATAMHAIFFALEGLAFARSRLGWPGVAAV